MNKFKNLEVGCTPKVIWKDYSETIPKEIQVSREQFEKINDSFVELLKNKVLYEAEEVKLPMTCGSLRVKKIKQVIKLTESGHVRTSRLKIDWAATKKEGKRIFHTNEHRGGYYYKIIWRKGNVKNVTTYSFIPERYTLSRKLAHILKNNPEIDFFN